MKRQNEELFFNYEINAYQKNPFELIVELPNEFYPFQGDIIEMIISEGVSAGGASYYAKLVCFGYGDLGQIQIDALDGKLETENGFASLIYANYGIEEGKKIVTLLASETETVTLESGRKYLVNMIVHRSNGKIKLYYL